MKYKWIKNSLLGAFLVSSMAVPTFATPDEVIGHIALPVWEYHETQYDAMGQERVKSDVTTFYTGPEKPINGPELPAFTAVTVGLGHDVVIPFTPSTETHKKWVNGIYKITTRAEYTNNPNMENELSFRIQGNTIILSKENRALSFNKVHNVKIYSKTGETAQVAVEVKKSAPRLRIHGNYEAVVNQDILFELLDFDYAITNPVYEVLLDGQVLKGDCDQYHVVSNLIRLEGNGHIKTPGKHTLTVRAYGFEEATLDFVVRENHNGYVAPTHTASAFMKKESLAGIDAMTSASGGSSGGSSDGSSGGSMIKPAKLIFNYDAVVNAYALRALGKQTADSERVLAYWEASSKESARLKGSETLYDWSDYKAQLMAAELKGESLTFETYTSRPDAMVFNNKYYVAKHVLDDGKLGKEVYFNRTNDQKAPVLTIESASVETGLLVNFEERADWQQALEGVYQFGYTKLDANSVNFEQGKLKLPATVLKYGKNSFTFRAKGFDDVVLDFIIEKDVIAFEVQSNPTLGSDVKISGFTQDYRSHLSGIQLNGKSLLSVEAGGTSGHYQFEGDHLILFAKNFSDNGKNIVKITSDRYKDRYLEFALNGDVIATPSSGKKLPYGLSQSVSLIKGTDLMHTVANDFSVEDTAYAKAFHNAVLKIDGIVTPYTIEKQFGAVKLVVASEHFSTEGVKSAVFEVTGYEPYAFDITVKVQNTLKTTPLFMPSHTTVTVSESLNLKLLNRVSESDEAFVTKLMTGTLTLNDEVTAYQVSRENGAVMLLVDGSAFKTAGNLNAVITVEGYKPYVFEVSVAEKVLEKTPATLKFVKTEEKKAIFGDEIYTNYVFEFDNNTDVAYVSSPSQLKLNGKTISYAHVTLTKSNYNQPITGVKLDGKALGGLLQDGENQLVIEQEGYTIQTINFIK